MDRITIDDYIKKNVGLNNYVTMRVGGTADYLIEAVTIDQVRLSVAWAVNNKIPYKVIGRGTNVIPGNAGYRGLVIVNKTSGINFDLDNSRVIVDAGYPLAKLILEAAAVNMGGLEKLFGIPGSVGGAAAVNAGTHGICFGSFIRAASILNYDGVIQSVDPSWFGFDYRSSKIKSSSKKYPPVIINLVLQLYKKKKESIMNEIAEYKKYRDKNQPSGFAASGSIFRNPSESDSLTNVKEKSAGYLLEQSGAKSLHVNGASVSKKHANWIINNGKANSQDVRKLIDIMREAVKSKYSVELEEEVEYFGAWDG